jgi:hypothetical protein
VASSVTISGTVVPLSNVRASQLYAVVSDLIRAQATQLVAFSVEEFGRSRSMLFLITPSTTLSAEIDRFDSDDSDAGVDMALKDNLDSLFAERIASRNKNRF